MYIEGISLENFSAPTYTETARTPQARTRRDVFHSFLYYDSRKYASKTTLHSKLIIELLKTHKIMSDTLNALWGNTYGCADHYICATSLYLMSILPQDFSVIIYHTIITAGHVR